jgi:hypothetical protein
MLKRLNLYTFSEAAKKQQNVPSSSNGFFSYFFILAEAFSGDHKKKTSLRNASRGFLRERAIKKFVQLKGSVTIERLGKMPFHGKAI